MQRYNVNRFRAKVNAKLNEMALHHAAKVNNVDLIEMLVEFVGNVYARDTRGKKYTRAGSPPSLCLHFYETMPLSLQQQCRVFLRKALGTRALEVVSKLHIPPGIINYLSYQ
ncbi:ankyrin repeat and SOCS box protein 13-like [Huso huso]|uniref:Ankyrin repeat and SOCS box protein 13-like n=1 Tax=Huso huso TaxID=61971 RepID=A0ABR0ZCL3_HUSHU